MRKYNSQARRRSHLAMPKTVVALMLVLSLISIKAFTFNVRMNQSLALSIPFGNASMVNIPGVITFSQEFQMKMWGMLSPFLYVNAEFEGTSFDHVAFTYVPWDVSFGNVNCKIDKDSSISIFGISSPFFSVGEMLGTLKSESFRATSTEMTVYVGPIFPQSLGVYVNGTEISSGYTADYQRGVVSVWNLSPGDVVSITYQNTEGSQGYVASFQKDSNTNGLQISLRTFGTFSRNNAFYVSSNISKGGMSFSTWFDFEEAFSASMDLKSHTSLGKMNTFFELKANTAGFHKPFGDPQVKNLSFTAKIKAAFENLTINGNLNSLDVSFKSKHSKISVGVGNEDNLYMDFSNDRAWFGFDLGRAFKDTYFGIKHGNARLAYSYQTSDGSNWELDVSSTPELSVGIGDGGNYISLRYSENAIEFQQGKDETFVELDGTHSQMTKYKLVMGTKYSNPFLRISSSFEIDCAQISLEASASKELSFDTSVSWKDINTELEYDNGVLKSSFNFQTVLFNDIKLSFTLELALSSNDWGGGLSFQVWKDDL